MVQHGLGVVPAIVGGGGCPGRARAEDVAPEQLGQQEQQQQQQQMVLSKL
jgi:hypothetical protein